MGIFLAILSPAISSSVNFIDKFLLEKYEVDPTVIATYSGIIAFLASLIIVYFTGFGTLNLSTAIVLIGSGMLTLLYTIPYYKALSLDDASRVVPIAQLTPVIVLIISTVFLGESFTMKQYLGAGLIIFASLLLSSESISLKFLKFRPSFWYMLVTIFLYAFSLILFKVGLNEKVDFLKTLPYEGVGIVIAAVLITIFPGNRKRMIKATQKLPKKVFVYMALNEAIFILARYIGFFALTFISVGVFSTINGLQPLFLFVYGIILSFLFPNFIKEAIDRKTLILKLASIVGIFSGMTLLFS